MREYTNITFLQVINDLGSCYPIWAIYTAEYNVLCLNIVNGIVGQIIQTVYTLSLFFFSEWHMVGSDMVLGASNGTSNHSCVAITPV